jgi:secreted trypsin-like serine protease
MPDAGTERVVVMKRLSISSRRSKTAAILALAAILVLAGGLIAAVNDGPDEKPQIIGGHRATTRISASLVRVLDFRADSLGECSGTIIAPRLVLTAGHCVETTQAGVEDSATGYRIIGGQGQHGNDGLAGALRASLVIGYPGYKRLSGPDAGLLVLATPAPLPSQQLVAARTDVSEGSPATIVGWAEHYAQRPEVKPAYEAPTVIQSARVCEGAHLLFQPQFEFCALDTPRFATGICKGDSGGPLLATVDERDVEIGIASHGDPTCSTHSPTTFTRISTILPWLRRWIEKVRA